MKDKKKKEDTKLLDNSFRNNSYVHYPDFRAQANFYKTVYSPDSK